MGSRLKSSIGLVFSVNDLAGKGIASWLRELVGFKKLDVKNELIAEAYYSSSFDVLLVGFNEDVIYFDFLDDVMDVDYYIVLSRHRSEAKVKSLTVHHTGNPWSRADFGGRPLELGIANPKVTKALLLNLLRYNKEFGIDDEFNVTYEVTHHGPTNLKSPLCFIEIGSSKEEWVKEDARKAVAYSVYDHITNPTKLPDCVVASGFGGNHYASRFTAMAIEKGICFAHMIAKYALKAMGLNELCIVTEQALTKSRDRVTHVFMEKKLRREWRDIVKEKANELGIEVMFT